MTSAYAQIGKSLLRQKDYAQAMAYFKLGNFRGDRVVLDSGYNKAFTQYRRELLMQWWWAFLLGAVLVVSALAVGRRLWRKSRCPAVCAVRESRPAQQWRFSKHLLFHPFDGFWDMKREGRGSLIFALLLVGLWIVANILSRQVTGFLFTETTVSTVDLPAEIRNVAVLFLLFTVGNWSITTLMGGEGTFRDIVMTFGLRLSAAVTHWYPAEFCEQCAHLFGSRLRGDHTGRGVGLVLLPAVFRPADRPPVQLRQDGGDSAADRSSDGRADFCGDGFHGADCQHGRLCHGAFSGNHASGIRG